MNYKNLFQIPLLLLSMSTFTLATVYKCGTMDSEEKPWRVYDNKPSGAEITLGGYDDLLSTYPTFKGKGRSNAYMLGSKSSKSELSWNNTKEFVCAWDMQIEEKYRITIYTTTEKGSRRFVFTHKKRDKGLYRKKYIGIGLSKKSISKKWQHIEADLAEKLDKYEPDNKLISINGIQVRGSGSFDNIELKSSLGYIDNIKRDCFNNRDYAQSTYCDKENQIAYHYTFSSAPEFGTYLYSINMQNGKILDSTLVSKNPLEVSLVQGYSDIPFIIAYDLRGAAARGTSVVFYHTKAHGKLEKILTPIPPESSEVAFMEITENNSKFLLHYYDHFKDYVKTYDISKLPTMTLLSTEEE